MSSLGESIDRLVKHYSSLFTLPALKKILLLIFTTIIITCIFTALSLNFSTLNLAYGLAHGFSLFSAILLADIIVYYMAMRNDPIFNFRRCLGLSMFSCFFWCPFVLIGAILILLKAPTILLLKLSLFGFCSALTLRFVVLLAISLKKLPEKIFAAIFPPIIYLLISIYIWSLFTSSINFPYLLFLSISIPATIIFSSIFIISINKIGKRLSGLPTLELLKAFLSNWIADLNSPLESLFERFGQKRDIQISVLAFKSKNKAKMKAMIVVPSFHPGPFKNVGSSYMPYMIQKTIEEKFGCIVAVPHGLFGHELNLASQKQNRKVLEALTQNLNFENFASTASPTVCVRNKSATTNCQIFGDCALFTATLAPKTTEDFPEEVGEQIINQTKKHGFSTTLIINAHNSINAEPQLEEDIKNMQNALIQCFEKAKKQKFKAFKVGCARANPSEYNLKDGMGPGGITTIIVESNGQKTAYIVFDGNNMISGLREKILESLKKMKINAGEVMTSDTHAVNAVILSRRGYYAVGEAMDHNVLIDYVNQTVDAALKNMEPAEASGCTISVPEVKVMGEKQIQLMSEIADKTIKRAKQSALLSFGTLATIIASLLAIL